MENVFKGLKFSLHSNSKGHFVLEYEFKPILLGKADLLF